jgi:Na+/proline symporter
MTFAADEPWVYLGLGILDWAVLALYFVVVLGIGVWSYRKVKDMADYFMGGRRFGKIFMIFFAFGSGTSSEQAIGVVAGTWRVGLAGIWWQFLWLWATPFYWIVAPVLRRMRALTTADYFQHRFDTSTATLYSFYGIIMSIAFMAAGLYGSGKMVNALTGGELDDAARERVVLVPEVKWNPYEKRFGRGVLFHSEIGSAAALDTGKIAPKLRRQFADSKHDLSDEVSVKKSAGRNGWEIFDRGYGLTYVVTRETDTVKKAGREIQVEKLRVNGAGQRRLQGHEYAILAMTVLFVFYGVAGGLGAAIITDFIQGILTIAFSFLLLPYLFIKIGGFGMLNAPESKGLKQGMLDLVASPDVAASLGKEPITIFYIFMLSLTALAGIVVQPHIMGVCGAGKTEMEGRVGFTFGNFMKRFCTMAWTFTGLACIVWYLGGESPLLHTDRPQAGTAEFKQLDADKQQEIQEDRKRFADLKQRNAETFAQLPESERDRLEKVEKDFADELFGKAAYDILPLGFGLIGLLMASLLAAVMSTSDALMVVSSGLFTENVYKRFLVRNSSQTHYLWVGRISGLLIVTLAIVLQASFSDVIDALKVIIKTPAAIGISLWFGIVWRRWTSAAVWGSTICSAATWAFVAYRPDLLRAGIEAIAPASLDVPGMFNQKGNLLDVWQMVAYLSAGVVSGFVISLITPRPSEEKLDRFFRLLHTPVTPGEQPEGPCTLPPNPAPQRGKLFPFKDIEVGKPTWVGIGGFLAAWACVAFIVWLTQYLAETW